MKRRTDNLSLLISRSGSVDRLLGHYKKMLQGKKKRGLLSAIKRFHCLLSRLSVRALAPLPTMKINIMTKASLGPSMVLLPTDWLMECQFPDVGGHSVVSGGCPIELPRCLATGTKSALKCPCQAVRSWIYIILLIIEVHVWPETPTCLWINTGITLYPLSFVQEISLCVSGSGGLFCCNACNIL